MKKLLIIDGDHILHRAYNKFKGLVGPKGSPTNCIYGTPYIARNLVNTFNPTTCFIAFGKGNHPERMKIHPEYKKREPRIDFDYEDFIRQKEIVMDLFRNLGLRVVYKENFESDDLITIILNRNYNHYSEIVITSGDKDFNQLIDEKTIVFNTNKEAKITLKTCKRHFGYEPNQTVDYLTLLGDKSDNIPGYPKIGEKRAIEFLEEHKSIKNYLKHNCSHKLINNDLLTALYAKNRYLIDLQYFYRKFLVKEPLVYLHTGFNQHEVSRVSRDFNINTFSKPEFINTFKNL